MTTARSVNRSTYTFKPRRRRLSDRRRADVARWLETRGLEPTGPALDWRSVFGHHRNAGADPVTDPVTDPAADVLLDVVLDIGFGHGESVLDLARRSPGTDLVAVEVHTPGVATLLEIVEREGLDNVRVVHGDALVFIERVPASSLAEVRALFPDPWTKTRQHHRRLVRDDVVAALTDRLRIGGVIRLATDIDDYADRMTAACEDEPRLSGGRIDEPTDRPTTRFERRAIAEGRRTTDLRYVRIA
jgi:tRNA (guanine-N7-)-methyltransferase